jgi:DNA-binding LacI/PurR family transcriptional regulator
LELYAETGNRDSETITPRTLRLFETNPRPDGLIGYNFNHAEAAQAVAMSLRLRAYEDFRMIHFASAWEYHPWISNLKDLFVLPERELGALSAHHILRRIDGESTDDLPVRLKGKLCLRKKISDDR